MAEYKIRVEGRHLERRRGKISINTCGAMIFSDPPFEGNTREQLLRDARNNAIRLTASTRIMPYPNVEAQDTVDWESGVPGIYLHGIHRMCQEGDRAHLDAVAAIGAQAVTEALQMRGHTVVD